MGVAIAVVQGAAAVALVVVSVVVAFCSAIQRRQIDPSGLEKLQAGISIPQLRTWRNRWGDFRQLNQLAEQMAAFTMVFDPAMQQIGEVALGILPTAALSPIDVLDQTSTYIRSKRNIALDRVAFEECEQSAMETFDDFYAIPDALSRAPVNDPGPDDEVTSSEMQSLVRRVVIHHVKAMHQVDGDVADSDAAKEPPHLPDPMLDDLRAAAASDTEYSELIAAILDGFTVPRHQMAQGVHQFWKIREELSVDEGLVLFGQRIVIPKLARRGLLRKLHAAHQGIVRMKRRARQTVFWSGIPTWWRAARTVRSDSRVNRKSPSTCFGIFS